ncbi:ankyrin repeat protein [Fusarium austroafricanum]|uniref:Ankyrin repeat protein n=1 Tax=Fusarium austroafricanum TaxID=2364996 RepID=A0A8H4NLZ8_9HYPO|nr:ankyrin repeat protein [Fusarium austroafricanum]
MSTEKTISATAHEYESILTEVLGFASSGLKWAKIDEELEDCRGRFSVWAANMGALQQPRSRKSLDSRLQSAPLMRSSILSGLERLKRSTLQILRILRGQGRSGKGAEDRPSGSNYEIEKDSPAQSELQEVVLNLVATLNHLFGLSVLIRRMRPKGRLCGIDKAPENPRDTVTVLDKFPKAKQQEWLAQRLGNAIGKRRHFFEYRQQHRKRLGTKRNEPNVSLHDTGETGLDAATTIATTFDENVGGEPSAVAQDSFERGSIFTTATSFVSDFDDSREMGRRIPDISDMVLDGTVLDYGIPVECPYCRTIQLFRNRLEWKKHVFSDLQPYVCTFKECSAGLFFTRHEWLKHELDTHRRRWKCIRCDTSKAVYSSEADMLAHLRKIHSATITENQAMVLLKACEEPQFKFDSSACPLCSEWNPPLPGADNAKEFFRHLAQHQQQIALEALPLYIEGLQVKDPYASEQSDTSGQGEDVSDAEEEDEDEPVKRESPKKPLFGLNLQTLYQRDGLAIPMIVYQCILAVDTFGLHTPGIHRLQGQGWAQQVQTLRTAFETSPLGPSLDFRKPTNFYHNIHNATDLFSDFFREMPDPLMTRQHYGEFIEAAKHENDIVRRDNLHAVINGLPDPNYATLRAVILHFNRVVTNSAQNYVNAYDLARVFGELFLRPFTGDRAETLLQIKALQTIIECTLDIFDED